MSTMSAIAKNQRVVKSGRPMDLIVRFLLPFDLKDKAGIRLVTLFLASNAALGQVGYFYTRQAWNGQVEIAEIPSPAATNKFLLRTFADNVKFAKFTKFTCRSLFIRELVISRSSPGWFGGLSASVIPICVYNRDVQFALWPNHFLLHGARGQGRWAATVSSFPSISNRRPSSYFVLALTPLFPPGVPGM